MENLRQARGTILRETGARELEIIVVDDGSRDRTAEIAGGYPDVILVRHPSNRGYGAALKSGFARATGEVLGFLDGDGTCDAHDFAPMLGRIQAEGVDLVLGTRLGQGSRMPFVRRVGNRIFAFLTRLLSGRAVTDIATGMRLFRREVLERLPPLPDGLHYTPAMTCHALYLTNLKTASHEISYRERVGKSKLRVIEDGLRFLKIILDSALVYFPLKILGSLGLLAILVGIAYGVGPFVGYLRNRTVPEHLIYRLLAVATFVTVGVVFLLVGVVAQKITGIARGEPGPGRLARLLHSPMFQHYMIVGGVVLALGGIVLNAANVAEYVRHGRILSHWSYILVGGLAVTLGALTFALGVLSRMVDYLRGRK